MSLSPIPQSPSEPEPISISQHESEEMETERDPTPMDVAVPEVASSDPTPTSRKPANSKRSKKFRAASEKYLAMGEQKLSLLKAKTLRLVPFTLPFTLSRHESLFRVLGLWDFAQLNLEKTINADLIMQLFAFYDPNGRKSMVNGVRILVSRADMARALCLPVKKKSSEELNEESFDSEEAGSVLSEFISSYLLFHLQEDDDACILPQEVLSATQLVKEGQANKVDWAGLIWGFVEKELQEVFKTGVCYYASHLQQLIRYQQSKLLEPVPTEPELVPEAGADTSADPKMEDEKQEDEAHKGEEDEHEEEECVEETKNVEELMDPGQTETGQTETGLNLGLGSDPVIENEGFGKEGDEVNWGLIQEKNQTGLRACGSSGLGLLEFENLDPKPVMGIREEDFKEEGEEDHIMHSFERLNSSTDLLQAMENVNNVNNMNQFDNGLDPHINIHNLDSGNFLSISRENHTHNNAGSFYFGNNGKRPLSEINEDDDDDDDDDNDDEGAHLHAKRIRNDDGNCSYSNNHGNQGQSGFFAEIEKAKMHYIEKDQALMNAQMELQYASGLIQQKDQMIQQLENARLEDEHRYRSDLCRFEHEMNVMAQVIAGYKKALKKNRALFSEYRRKFPDPEEKPYYVDVPNGGGLMVSRKELERITGEREIEMRELASRLVGDFEREWMERFEGYRARLEEMERKLKLIDAEIPSKEREVGGVNEGNGDEGMEVDEIGVVDEGGEGNGQVEGVIEGNGEVGAANKGAEGNGEAGGVNEGGEGNGEVGGVNEGGEGNGDEGMEVEKTSLPLDQ